MPIERRDILFYLPEIHSALIAGLEGDSLRSIHIDINNMMLQEAMHTDERTQQFRERRKRMEALLKEPAVGAGVLFRAVYKSVLGFDKPTGFFIPDPVMVRVLVQTCREQGIQLPRNAVKTVIVEDLYVGLRINIGDNNLELE